jgi:iron complex transport system substrate-binding protein
MRQPSAATNLRRYLNALLAAGALCAVLLPAHAAHAAVSAITVMDDAGNRITLAAPARRIVSLAPHATELLYAAGAGASVRGVSQYSDFPPAAKQVASVGGASALDLEKIITLQPDLVVAWRNGNSAAQIARLRQLHIPVFESEPADFDTVASSLERLSQLAGTEATGRSAAAAFRLRLQRLRASYSQQPPVRVFYQVWSKPLMTLNDRHLVSAALHLCGAENIFGRLPQMVPAVSREAVLTADPEAVVSAGAERDEFSDWLQFPQMTAVARHNLFKLEADQITRAGPRILDGTEDLCRQLQQARSRRAPVQAVPPH